MKRLGGSLGLLALCLGTPARAEDAPPLPTFAIAARETFDLFAVPSGIRAETVVLNKIQLSASLNGDEIGLSGWTAHAQLFRFDGQSLSSRMGDLQTADNIEAAPATRLFEAYLARTWSDERGSLALRAGLIDLNSQFDSLDVASLMLNSSHGIAPDLSRSGVNGPSIYPITALGTTATWVRSQNWTFRAGVFDGVAGDPSRPHSFFAERVKANDGLLLIGQADWQLSKASRVEAGVWTYTASHIGLSGVRATDRGVYASYEGPLNLIPRLDVWLRAGVANGAAQTIDTYLGAGLARQGILQGRPKDRLGLAVAHASLDHAAAETLGTYKAETSVELTYQARIGRSFVIQPDVDYVHHPAGIANAPDSVGLGLRFVYVAAHPISTTASDPGDPTIPPDGSPSPADDDE